MVPECTSHLVAGGDRSPVNGDLRLCPPGTYCSVGPESPVSSHSRLEVTAMMSGRKNISIYPSAETAVPHVVPTL
ncbi:hypothetical protein BV20DRAFT_81978 [Pilatotrama ljubarskyi]|nr:hypothetical protein BV20DRAFT_81978 [Pilatotrama ljubarskyi]